MRRTPFRSFDVVRIDAGARTHRAEAVALEEPLEIRVAGDTFAVTMRTPGNDRELALGLLFAEGVISSTDDVSAIAHCGRTGDAAREGTIDVTPSPGARLALPDDLPGRRGTLTTSACGVCGRQSIDDLVARLTPLPTGPALPASALARAVASLADDQPLFAETGGCHAAALITFSGVRAAGFEDVGRHNAVDKVVGAMLLARRVPLAEHVLAVSGRTSFEVVQKAALAGIPVVAGVSAPSSLAVELAVRAGVTLAGFVRGQGFNVYARAERIR